MSAELNPTQVAKLVTFVRDGLALRPMDRPTISESEPEFTGRVLQPIVGSVLSEIRHAGLKRMGDGATSVRTVHAFGLNFYPDIAISYFDQLLLAVEVKVLRGFGRQSAICSAMGQAILYRSAGYASSLVVLVDAEGVLSDEAVMTTESALKTHSSGIEVVIRVASAGGLRPHPMSIALEL
jgi:hypothetical protein